MKLEMQEVGFKEKNMICEKMIKKGLALQRYGRLKFFDFFVMMKKKM
jgi:hypothetical protein